MVNKRCVEIITTLAEKSQPVKIAQLAASFTVSARTIRNDLSNIDDLLRENGLPPVKRGPAGCGLSFRPQQFEHLRRLLRSGVADDYIMTAEERLRKITLMLLLGREGGDYETTNGMAEYLRVSRGTMNSDLRKAEQQLAGDRLSLRIVKAHGLRVEGRETDIRNALARLLSAGNGQQREQPLRLLQELQPMPGNTDAVLRGCLKKVEGQLGITFTDTAFDHLVLTMHIMLLRIQHLHILEPDDSRLGSVQDKEEFIAAVSIANAIEKALLIKIPAAEVRCVAMLLLSANVTSLKCPDKDNWVQLRLDVLRLIRRFEQSAGAYLSGDNQLFDGLLQHIRPMIYRSRYGVELDNPLLNEIKSNMHPIFELTRSCIHPVEEEYHILLTDAEVGYLALYFQTALEKIRPAESSRKRVVIACEAGLGTAKLLQLRLNEMYSVDVVDTVRLRDLAGTVKKHPVDCVVSTLPVSLPEVVCITVNPFIGPRDIEILNRYLPVKKAPEFVGIAGVSMDSLISEIEKSAVVKNRHRLAADLERAFGWNRARTEKIGLLDLLREDDILLQVEASGWEDAVRVGGMLLQRRGRVDTAYIHEMIQNVKNMGPYIVIMPGIAMPHANAGDVVHDIGFSIITLKNPVAFGNRENDPVRVVICLCAIDQVRHMQALAELMTVIEDPGFLTFACSVSEKEDFLRYLQKTIHAASDAQL